MSIKLNGWLLAAAVTTVLLIIGLLLLTSAGKPAEQEAGAQTEQVSENSAVAEHAALKKQPSDWRCFNFNPATPNSTNITAQGSYTPSPTTDPCGTPVTLCKICFDVDEFPLDGGLPDFGNTELNTLVQDHALSSSYNGQNIPTSTPDSYMRFYFKPNTSN